MYQYRGAQDKEHLVAYMHHQARPTSEEKTQKLGVDSAMSRQDDLTDRLLQTGFGNNNYTTCLCRLDATVVGFFSGDDSPLYQEYMAAANVMRGTFRYVRNLTQPDQT